MKKNLTLTGILMLFIAVAFGQVTEDRRGYIGISVGSSMPIGNFASKNANASKAGLATTGAIFDVSFAYKLKKNFGLAALLRGQYNPVDVQPLADRMNREFPGVRTYANGDGWSSGGFMGGVYSSSPLNQKATAVFELKTLVGFMNTTSPQIDMNASSSEGSIWIRQNSATATSFSYLIGAGMRFNAGKRIAFILNADYLNYTPNFKNLKTTTSMGSSENSNATQEIQTLNIGVGIAFRLK
ncbi:MAG: hypothetical protein KIT80_08540 [Chitinophagaceae bacterium]|nr:hypothetical protein [Chitinophagaceae bacterium]MCW5926943.1 hypothetical protein [Chitinophagaceae bacterium]